MSRPSGPSAPRHHRGSDGRFLGVAFWISTGILLTEAMGGSLTHSLALLSDAGHMLTDVFALGLAWYATRLAGRAPTPRRTYGFHRAEILPALINAGTLVAIAAGILVYAAGRLRHPLAVQPGTRHLAARRSAVVRPFGRG